MTACGTPESMAPEVRRGHEETCASSLERHPPAAIKCNLLPALCTHYGRLPGWISRATITGQTGVQCLAERPQPCA
jgi:hypothetical protein